jgi:branched-subunit amino acid transport protein
MVLFRKRIDNVWIRSFLHYVPYAVLGAMTFPAVFSSTGTSPSAVAGSVVAIVLAYFKRSLLTVALGAAATVFVVQVLGF